MKAVRRWINSQSFHPGPWGWLVNPFYIARRELDKAIASVVPEVAGSILDVGCGSKPYEVYFDPRSAYIGVEVSNEAHDHSEEPVDVLYDGRTLPFGTGVFGAVVSFQVLEHVPDPGRFVSELRRVVRDGGWLVLSVPLVWEVHEAPVDFVRFTEHGLVELLVNHGFDVDVIRRTGSGLPALCQIASAAWVRRMDSVRPGWFRFLGTMLISAPLMAIGGLAASYFRAESALYLDNVVRAHAVPVSN